MRNLVLGGAQFIPGYGKIVKTQTLDIKSIEGILHQSSQALITEIDIAENYIGAKEILALILKINNFEISTKIEFQGRNPDEIISSLLNTLGTLGKNSFHTIYIHDWMSLTNSQKCNSLEFLNMVRLIGITEKIGISIYELKDLEGLVSKVDFIQAPLNYFNRDFLKSDVVNDLINKGTKFSARSIFHQGTLLANDVSLRIKYPAIQEFESYCKSRKLSRLEGALSIYDSQEIFSKLVVGVDSELRLLEILNCKKHVFNDIPAINRNKYQREFFDPRMW